jgi:hypothetical protein
MPSAFTTRTNNEERKLKMKKTMKFLSIIASVMVLLSASLAMAQQATPESSPPMHMQSPGATQASPSLQPNEQSAQSMQKNG